MNIAQLRTRRAVIAWSLAAAGGIATRRRGYGFQTPDPVVVRMITHLYGLGDNGYNDLGNAGGMRAVEELGVDFSVIESAGPTDFVLNTQESAIVSDLTVGLGDLLRDTIERVSAEFAGRRFAILDSIVDGPNIASYTFREEEGYFLAGVLAARMTMSGTLGIVGGIRVPPIIRSEVGFRAGVQSIVPEIDILVGYADSFSDPTLGKELATAQISAGADIVMPIAGRTGDGAYSAAADDSNVWIIAADADKSALGAEHQLAVVRKGVDDAMFDAIKSIVDGDFTPGHRNWGLAENAVGLSLINPSVDRAVRDEVDRYAQAILDQRLDVPSTDEELAQFVPIDPADLAMARF